MSNININLLLFIGFILLAVYSITTRIVNNRANKDKKENDNYPEDSDPKE